MGLDVRNNLHYLDDKIFIQNKVLQKKSCGTCFDESGDLKICYQLHQMKIVI